MSGTRSSRWTAQVITVSTRAAAGAYPDSAGPAAAAALAGLGFDVADVIVVPDGVAVGWALTAAVKSGVDCVVTCGGTGIAESDRTPEQTAPVLDRQLPGIAEQLRAHGARNVPTAALSRGLAGLAGSTLIVNLPGSEKAVRESFKVLAGLLPHAMSQLHGGDHTRPDQSGGHHHG